MRRMNYLLSMDPNAKETRVKKSVSFDHQPIIHYISEDSEWSDYRKPYWLYVTADRLRIERKIHLILYSEHRRLIKLYV